MYMNDWNAEQVSCDFSRADFQLRENQLFTRQSQSTSELQCKLNTTHATENI
jgi:hypothetical protein